LLGNPDLLKTLRRAVTLRKKWAHPGVKAENL